MFQGFARHSMYAQSWSSGFRIPGFGFEDFEFLDWGVGFQGLKVLGLGVRVSC